MRWYAFFPLLLVCSLATPTSLPDQAGDLGQVTLSMHATVAGHAHFTTNDGCKIDDEVTIDVTERIQYRIAKIVNGALDLEVMSHQNSFSASGGGKVMGKNCEGTWTYQIKDHTPYQDISVWVNLGTGKGGFMIATSFIKDAELATNLVVRGNSIKAGPQVAGMGAWGVADKAFMAISQEAQDALKKLEFTFKPYAKNVSAQRSASYTYQSPDPAVPFQAELHIDFSLVTGAQEDSEAEIIPPGAYASWVPEAGADEQKPGNTIKIKARVHKKGDPKTPFYKKTKFKFQLVDVSKEKGVCLNWPDDKNSTDGFDLKIDPESNDLLKVAGDGQSAESAMGLNESTVTITSHDWGAYGKLKVTVVFDDGSGDTAHVLGDASKQVLTVPKDDNDNHIADFWEKHYPGGGSDPKTDDDLAPPGNGDKGDGLSLFEEYRGFRVQGKHIRTSPIEKDLFVRDDDNLGLGYFGQSGLVVHLVREEENGLEDGATNPWVINLHRGFATRGQQHILKMWNENLPGLFGRAEGIGPGTPKTTKAVKIDVASCLTRGTAELQSTIAHELSHGCNVRHHGSGNYKVKEVEFLMPDGTWSGFTSKETLGVAVQGGQESGVEQCIMRYEGEAFYENPKGTVRWKKSNGALQQGELYGPFENPGTIFCEKPDGTGVNDNKTHPGGSKAGNATVGICKKQFCVNDNKQ
jgi:hypothetical protein